MNKIIVLLQEHLSKVVRITEWQSWESRLSFTPLVNRQAKSIFHVSSAQTAAAALQKSARGGVWPGKSISAHATYANCERAGGRADDITKIQKIVHFESARRVTLPNTFSISTKSDRGAWLCRLWSRVYILRASLFRRGGCRLHQRSSHYYLATTSPRRQFHCEAEAFPPGEVAGTHSSLFLMPLRARTPPRKRPSGGGPKLLEEAALWLARLDLYRHVAINFTQAALCKMRFSASSLTWPFFQSARKRPKFAYVCVPTTCVCGCKHTITGRAHTRASPINRFFSTLSLQSFVLSVGGSAARLLGQRVDGNILIDCLLWEQCLVRPQAIAHFFARYFLR